MSGPAMINALQGGQIVAEFRGFSPAEKSRLVDALGDKASVQEAGWVCKLDILFNTTKKTYDDVRVRRALNMAIGRWDGARNLQLVAFVRHVGGIIRPGYQYAAEKDELTKYIGYSENIAAAREEANRNSDLP